MAEKEQVTPLAPATLRIRPEEDELFSPQPKHFQLRQWNYIKYSGCVAAVFVIFAMIILVLKFTVFHIRNPVIRINNLVLQQLEFANGTLRTDVNVTLLANVTVKNPNVASFKFNNGTTKIYYGGVVIGEAETPAGKAKARQTVHMNVTVSLVPEKFLSIGGLMNEVSSGALRLNSTTTVDGKVKILNVVKKHVVLRISCRITYNISSQAIQEQNCRRM